MEKTKDGIEEKIKNRDPWYVNSQTIQILAQHTKRTIFKRWHFILYSIGDYIRDNLKEKVIILDAGCGDGVNLCVLNSIKNSEIFAIDYNPIRLERVKKIFQHVKTLNVKLEELNLNLQFDIIICTQVLEHINNDEIVLKSLYNILKDDGLLILGLPNEGCFLAQLRNRILEPSIKQTTDHINFYTIKSIKKKINDAGFLINTVLYENFFVPNTIIFNYLASTNTGFGFMNLLGNLFKSQVGGFYFSLIKA